MGNGHRLSSDLPFNKGLHSILVVILPVELIQIPQQHTIRREQRLSPGTAVEGFTQDEPFKTITRECLRQRPALRIAQSEGSAPHR